MLIDRQENGGAAGGGDGQDRLDEALVSAWSERIRRAVRHEEPAHRAIRKARAYLRDGSEQGGANLIQSTLAALVPHIYARAPEVAVTPEPNVEGVVPEHLRAFARTLERVVNRELQDAGIKRLGKRAVRAAMVSRVAWAKVIYQRDIFRDPQVERRLEDSQDNIRRLEALIASCEDDKAREAHEADLARMRDLVAALEAQVEVVRSEGLVIDLVRAEDVLVSPEVRELADYRYAPWIAHRIWMSAQQARETFGLDDQALEGADRWRSGEDALGSPDGTETASQGLGADEGWLAVWEIWDKRTQTVYTWVQGCKGWAREPYQPQRLGEQWYPFFPLAFHWLECERWPRSDVELLRDLQEEYAETRAKYREHRRRAVPSRVALAGAIEPADTHKLADPELNEVVPVSIPAGMKITDVVALLPYPPVDPALYDTSQVRADIELVSGLQDAARGSVLRAKTATEAEIMQMGLVSRVTERQDEVEAWITEIARYAGEVLLQELTPAQAERIAGEGAVWPALERDEIYRMVRIEVRAGSTGRPDQRREQETWIKLLPIIQEAIAQIVQAEAAGQQPLADAVRRLLQETLSRFDEGIDVEALLPASSPAPAASLAGLPQPAAGDVPDAQGAPAPAVSGPGAAAVPGI